MSEPWATFVVILAIFAVCAVCVVSGDALGHWISRERNPS